MDYICTAHPASAPRLAYTSRSRCTTPVHRKSDIRGTQSHVPKSGGRQPAVDVVTASATAFVHGRPARRRCAAIVVLPLQARYTNHGWLTPAAPDARRRCTEKTIFAVHNRMFPRAARVSPPWLGMRTLCRENHALFADSATPEQERRASACRGRRTEPSAARITHCSPTVRRRTRAAGVSPPWMW
jgi:hypothetical protein